MVMTVLMGSYYLDLEERHPEMPSYKENGTWYRIGVLEDTMEMDGSTDTIQGCQNIMEYYERLHDSEEHPIFSVDTVNDCYVKEDDLRDLFGKAGCDNFISENNPGAMTICFGPEAEGDMCSVLAMKCAMLDDTAFEIFGLQTEEGEGFTKSNLTLQNTSDPAPVLLGHEYKGILSVGDRIEIAFADYAYSCRVAGILEKNSMIPWQGDGSEDMVILDYHIIFPYTIRVSEDTGHLEDIAKYAARDLQALTFNSSMVWAEDEKDFRDVVSLFRDIGNEYDFPPMELYAASMGLRLLHKESAARVRIMLILTVTLIGFTFYGLFTTFFDKIQSNNRVYGIYLMNGCSLSMILVPLLLEIAVILVPAAFVSRLVFERENSNIYYMPEDIIRTACVIAGLVFVVGIGVVAFLMRGVDTEHLIRQKD